MAAVDDPKTYGRARLSFASEADIDEFVTVLEQYERGELTPDQWRAFRLLRGTYGQRQAEDAQMLRVKIPQGILTSDQLEALADVGGRYSRGFGHITTRQNVQFHFVKLHDAELAMRRLAEVGLTTREACGNSVRNITGCPYAGVAAGAASVARRPRRPAGGCAAAARRRRRHHGDWRRRERRFVSSARLQSCDRRLMCRPLMIPRPTDARGCRSQAKPTSTSS